MVYSSEESAREMAQQMTQRMTLKCVTDAIDQLDANCRAADARDLEAQVAAIWAMVRVMDPELAKVASKYIAPA